jgi:hypothetical protein
MNRTTETSHSKTRLLLNLFKALKVMIAKPE